MREAPGKHSCRHSNTHMPANAPSRNTHTHIHTHSLSHSLSLFLIHTHILSQSHTHTHTHIHGHTHAHNLRIHVSTPTQIHVHVHLHICTLHQTSITIGYAVCVRYSKPTLKTRSSSVGELIPARLLEHLRGSECYALLNCLCRGDCVELCCSREWGIGS